MYRIIASDLDETLLTSAHVIPDRVRHTIARARAMGVHFVPTTGRPFASVRELDDLGLAGMPDEYVISFNGGVITENVNMRPLVIHELDHTKADLLYRYGMERGICMHVYTLDVVYLTNYPAEERAYIEGRMNIQETSEPTLDFLSGTPVIKVIFMNTDTDLLHALAQDLHAKGLTEGVEVSYSANRYLELNAAGVNKGAGLQALAERLGIPMEETMAIGDSENDASMLRAAGLGVAVANANDVARDAADYICEDNNEAGGVAEAIERFVLGEA